MNIIKPKYERLRLNIERGWNSNMLTPAQRITKLENLNTREKKNIKNISELYTINANKDYTFKELIELFEQILFLEYKNAENEFYGNKIDNRTMFVDNINEIRTYCTKNYKESKKCEQPCTKTWRGCVPKKLNTKKNSIKSTKGKRKIIITNSTRTFENNKNDINV